MTGAPTDDATANDLLRLERALAVRDDAAVADGLASLLGPEFLEIGASGRVWTRGATISALLSGAPAGPLEISEFSARAVAPDVVLVTYTMTMPSARRRLTRRSSLWRRTKDGWRVVFHQGTPVPEDEAGG